MRLESESLTGGSVLELSFCAITEEPANKQIKEINKYFLLSKCTVKDKKEFCFGATPLSLIKDPDSYREGRG